MKQSPNHKKLSKLIEEIIDTLEFHTITKEDVNSQHAVKEAFKGLYTLKTYFETKIKEEE